MAVKVRIPTMLQPTTQGEKVVAGEGTTIGEVLINLGSQYPGFRERLTDDDGGLHRFINIYKNDEDVRYLEKLETPVKDGDVISILPAVAGGAASRSDVSGRSGPASTWWPRSAGTAGRRAVRRILTRSSDAAGRPLDAAGGRTPGIKPTILTSA